ncbi:MAG: 16S rRNA (cytosine(1402)-N(4))-methyltransferase RsmH [Desulfobacterales bacterium]|nr:16S rRNA (cytosine(1402)-N(4))-methyltransferase RsmH [Desulfobacterales bacterium]
MGYPHQPVLVKEVLEYIIHDSEGIYVDGTVGSAGHSLAIGKNLGRKGRLICLDRDPDAVRLSKKRLAFLGDRACVIKANYAELDKVLKDLRITEVGGILLDLGMSSHQIEKSGRGFSFNRDEPLDMRMDPDDEINACHLVNNLSQRDLEDILRNYGEEKRAKSIARAITIKREKNTIETSLQLATLVKSIFPPAYRYKARHPATRTFQAFRVAVNKELQNIEVFLNKIPFLMARGGRLVILAYHSLEDRLVKRAMINWEKKCICPPDFPVCVCEKVPVFKRLFKKGLRPGKKEIEENPRARSVVFRVAERI